jgi:hypothetical protein
MRKNRAKTMLCVFSANTKLFLLRPFLQIVLCRCLIILSTNRLYALRVNFLFMLNTRLKYNVRPSGPNFKRIHFLNQSISKKNLETKFWHTFAVQSFFRKLSTGIRGDSYLDCLLFDIFSTIYISFTHPCLLNMPQRGWER